MKVEDIEVRCEPLVGQQITPAGTIEVDMNINRVFANGIHVGYVGRKEGNRIQLLSTVKLPDAVKDHIKSKVDEALGFDTGDVGKSAHIEHEAFDE